MKKEGKEEKKVFFQVHLWSSGRESALVLHSSRKLMNSLLFISAWLSLWAAWIWLSHVEFSVCSMSYCHIATVSVVRLHIRTCSRKHLRVTVARKQNGIHTSYIASLHSLPIQLAVLYSSVIAMNSRCDKALFSISPYCNVVSASVYDARRLLKNIYARAQRCNVHKYSLFMCHLG